MTLRHARDVRFCTVVTDPFAYHHRFRNEDGNVKRISIAALGAVLVLAGCGEDMARAVGTQDGRTVYQVYGKSPVPNSTTPRAVQRDPVAWLNRREAMTAMAEATCPDGYTNVGDVEITAGYWQRGETGQPFNGELRESQRIVCD